MSEELVKAEITRIDHLLSSSTEDSDLSYLSIELIFFVLIDGWSLLSASLVKGFTG